MDLTIVKQPGGGQVNNVLWGKREAAAAGLPILPERVRCFVPYLAADYGHPNLGDADGVHRPAREVVVEQDEIRQLAGFERPLLFFRELGIGGIQKEIKEGKNAKDDEME